jgi:hypothetical protein
MKHLHYPSRLPFICLLALLCTLITASSMRAAIIGLDLGATGFDIQGAGGNAPEGGTISVDEFPFTASGSLFISNGDTQTIGADSWTYTGLEGIFGLAFAIGFSEATPVNFSAGQEIGTASNFSEGNGYSLFLYSFNGETTTSPDFGAGSYLGFRATPDDTDYFYGWLEVEWSGGSDEFSIISGAYESVANVPISAGATSSAVPEPSQIRATLLLLGLLWGVVMFRRYRRKRRGALASAALLLVFFSFASAAHAQKITTGAVLPSGLLGETYHSAEGFALSASGGVPPYTWRIARGSVPGLSLSASGVLSGAPSALPARGRPYYLSVRATGANGRSTRKAFRLFVGSRSPLVIASSPAPPSGQLDTPYAGHVFTATGGATARTWSISSGFLPAGMSLNATTGRLSGTPANAGVFQFGLRVESLHYNDEIEVVLAVDDPDTGTRVSDVLSLLPEGPAPQAAGNATCSFDYSPSGSTWTSGLDEESVFLASITTDDLRLGIGRGGQIYSLRGPFGESIPPQRTAAPWIDEVWQFVATNNDLVTPIKAFQASAPANRAAGRPMEIFIHQAGIYLEGLAGNDDVGFATAPFYAPPLKTGWNPATRTFRMVSWSQMARSPNVWKSGLLTYTSYRDLGNGVIEATNIVSNFGDVELTFINTPWGGPRYSPLPRIAVSLAAGGWQEYAGNFPSPLFLARNTAGWVTWSENPDSATASALSLVFGEDLLSTPLPVWKGRRPVLRVGTAGDLVNRNYSVAELSNVVKLPKGQTLACRWHLVGGNFQGVSQQSASLKSFAGMWQPETDASALVPVWVSNGVPSSSGTGDPQFHLYAQPIPGTLPVFAIEDTRDGRIFATQDPYTLCPTAPFANPLPPTHASYATYQDRVVHYQYDSPGQLRDLLGYAFPAQPPGGNDENITLPGESGALSLWAPQLP